MDIRLIGTFTVKSPVSHIGESIGTTAYLIQEPVIQPDGEVEEVFAYNGNAWRGQLRDTAAAYLLDAVGAPRISNDTFHLLFGGGKIGGEQVVDLARARAYRQALPMLSILGGGVGNQIMPGKLRVGNSYPVCHEAAPVLRDTHPITTSYRSMTTEKSFSRKDDAKDERLSERYLALPAPEQGQLALDGEGEPKKKGKGDGEVADQMRMTVELLVAGVRLETWIDAIGVSEVELGCLVSAIHRWSRSPHIGGQGNKGHGLVDLRYDMIDLETGIRQPFLAVGGSTIALEAPAEAAKGAYDQHVRQLYDAMLVERSGEIVKMLGVAS